MTCRTTAMLAIAAVFPTSGASAQQVLEVGVDSGRTVVGGLEYGFGHVEAVDPTAGLIYVVEAGDPYVIQAISLDDGSVVGKFGRGRGDGPGELRQIAAMAVGPDGVFVSDGRRIDYWRLSGELEYGWRPEAPPTLTLCSFGGRPAVPLQSGGVAVRGPGGSSEPVGADRVSKVLRIFGGPADRDAVFKAFIAHRELLLTCSDHAAYVLSTEGLTRYRRDRDAARIALPVEVTEAAGRVRENVPSGAWHDHGGYGRFFLADGAGRLAITFRGQRLAGAIVDPETGCYALIQDNGRARLSRWYVGMHRDSIVAMETTPTTRTVNGRRQTVMVAEPSAISLFPLLPVSGEPCA